MSKSERLHQVKKDLYKKLYELIEDENEIETIEGEIYKDKRKKATRRGMIDALTEDFFTKIIKITEEEEKLEAGEKQDKKPS